MGDKSPKSQARQKKQAASVRSQKKDQAYAKAHPQATMLGKQKAK